MLKNEAEICFARQLGRKRGTRGRIGCFQSSPKNAISFQPCSSVWDPLASTTPNIIGRLLDSDLKG